MCRFCMRRDDGSQFTRREMLGMTGAGLAVSLAAPAMLTAAETGGSAANPSPDDPLRIRVVYVHQKEKQWLGWPGSFWDPKPFTDKSKALVNQFAEQLQMKVSFEPEPIHEAAEVEAFVKKVQDEHPHGAIVFPLNADEFINRNIDKIAQSGVPTVIFGFLGTFHTGFADAVVPVARRHRSLSPLVE